MIVADEERQQSGAHIESRGRYSQPHGVSLVTVPDALFEIRKLKDSAYGTTRDFRCHSGTTLSRRQSSVISRRTTKCDAWSKQLAKYDPQEVESNLQQRLKSLAQSEQHRKALVPKCSAEKVDSTAFDGAATCSQYGSCTKESTDSSSKSKRPPVPPAVIPQKSFRRQKSSLEATLEAAKQVDIVPIVTTAQIGTLLRGKELFHSQLDLVTAEMSLSPYMVPPQASYSPKMLQRSNTVRDLKFANSCGHLNTESSLSVDSSVEVSNMPAAQEATSKDDDVPAIRVPKESSKRAMDSTSTLPSSKIPTKFRPRTATSHLRNRFAKTFEAAMFYRVSYEPKRMKRAGTVVNPEKRVSKWERKMPVNKRLESATKIFERTVNNNLDGANHRARSTDQSDLPPIDEGAVERPDDAGSSAALVQDCHLSANDEPAAVVAEGSVEMKEKEYPDDVVRMCLIDILARQTDEKLWNQWRRPASAGPGGIAPMSRPLSPPNPRLRSGVYKEIFEEEGVFTDRRRKGWPISFSRQLQRPVLSKDAPVDEWIKESGAALSK